MLVFNMLQNSKIENQDNSIAKLLQFPLLKTINYCSKSFYSPLK